MLARSGLLGFLPPSGHGSISRGGTVWLALTGFSAFQMSAAENEVEAPGSNGSAPPSLSQKAGRYRCEANFMAPKWFERPLVEMEDERLCVCVLQIDGLLSPGRESSCHRD